MKFVVENRALLKALEHICNIVERRNTIPILANVLLEAESARLVVTGTNLDIELTEKVSAAVESGGKVTVGAALLCSIIKKLPAGGQALFELDKQSARMKISCGRSKFELATLPHEDFPTFVVGRMKHEFQIDAAALRHLVESVRITMSTEETRYYLNGFFLHEKDKRLVAVSTDGHRLTKYQTDLPDGAEGMPEIIVPRQTANAMFGLLDGTDGEVTLRMSDSKVTLSFGDTEFRSKLVDGTYPPYDRVIPTANGNILKISRPDLAEAVGRLSVINVSRASPIKLTIDTGAGRMPSLSLSTQNVEAGSASEDVGEVDYAGVPLEIAFNTRYLGEMLSGLDCDEVRFLFSDAGSPAVIEPIGSDGKIFILMPLRA